MHWSAVELVTFVLVPAIVLIAIFAVLLPRLYSSAQADRHEKNGHHLATAIVAIAALAVAVPLFLCDLRLYAFACVAFCCVILPIRTIVIESGIRRRDSRLPPPSL